MTQAEGPPELSFPSPEVALITLNRPNNANRLEPQDLAALTQMVRPHVAIVTTIAPAHMEFFGSEEAIADAKGEIFEGLEPGGTAIVPFDSPHYARLRAKAEQHAAHVVSFGLGEGGDFYHKC